MQMKKKFVNLPNVEPIWSRINDLYIRKNSPDNVIAETVFVLSHQAETGEIFIPNLDDVNEEHKTYNITQIDYDKFKLFLETKATVKYIQVKDTNKYYPAVSIFRQDTQLTEQELSDIVEKTKSALIRTDIGIYEVYAAHMRNNNGGIGEYKFIRKPYLVPLRPEEIKNIVKKVFSIVN